MTEAFFRAMHQARRSVALAMVDALLAMAMLAAMVALGPDIPMSYRIALFLPLMVPGALAPLAAWRAWDDYSVARALTKSALPFTIVDLPRRSYLVRGWGYVAVGEVGAAVVGLRVSGWPPIGQIRTLAMVWTGVAIMLAGTLGAVFAFNAWQATVPGGRIVVPGGGAI